MKIFYILVKNFYCYFYGRKEFIKTLLFIKLIVSLFIEIQFFLKILILSNNFANFG